MYKEKTCSKCEELKNETQFYCHKLAADGLQSRCKTCFASYNSSLIGKGVNKKARKKYKASAKGKAADKRDREKEGRCVYIATYSEGRYIGSGQTVERRRRHLNGNSGIAKKLGSKAISFEVLFKGTKEECREAEARTILNIGIKNLLNTDY